MARVRLYLDHPYRSQVYRFTRPGGVPDTLPGLRLKAFVSLSGLLLPTATAAPYLYPVCVVDTGAHLSIVPFQLWQHLRPGVVTPLPFDPAMPVLLRSVTIAGGVWPYELGEITLPLRDPSGGRLDVRVVAKFTRDGGALNIPLTLGLRGGVLDGRVLKAQPDPSAPFGQAWTLEDP